MQLVLEAVSDALGIIFTESYISLAALLGMFLMTFGFASAGGVGASTAAAGSTVAKFAKDEDSIRSRLALRCALQSTSTVLHILLMVVSRTVRIGARQRCTNIAKRGDPKKRVWT